MIIHFFDRKLGEARIQTQTREDVWHLYNLIRPKDKIKSKTWRTFKVGTKEEKKPVTILIEVESVEFSESLNRLRCLGIIVEGTPEEHVQKGKHHTIEIDEDTEITVFKMWKAYEEKRLQEAVKESKKAQLHLCMIDESTALFATVRGYGIDYGHELRSNSSKRDEKFDEKKNAFLKEIAEYIIKTQGPWVVAGPGFAKDNLKQLIMRTYGGKAPKIHYASASYAERNGVQELIKDGIIESILGEERLSKEHALLEEFLKKLHTKETLVAYGEKQVERAQTAGAISTLLVLDELIRTKPSVRTLVENAESNGTALVIFSSRSDTGDKLRGFGGLAALLRFAL